MSSPEIQRAIVALLRKQPGAYRQNYLIRAVGRPLDADAVAEALADLCMAGPLVAIDFGDGEPAYALEWGVKATWEVPA